jgi:hypothetical protein
LSRSGRRPVAGVDGGAQLVPDHQSAILAAGFSRCAECCGETMGLVLHGPSSAVTELPAELLRFLWLIEEPQEAFGH